MSSRIPMSSLYSTVLAFFLAFGAVVLIIFTTSAAPATTLSIFLTGPLKNRYYFGNLLNETAVLSIIACGISLSFRSGVFNLGGEGQIFASGFIVAILALTMPYIPVVTPLLLLVTAMLCGAVISGLSGLLEYRHKINEVITTYFISSALIIVINFLIQGPFLNRSGNILSTATIEKPLVFPALLPPSSLNITFIFAVFIVVLAWVFLFKTPKGYLLRTRGMNREVLRYAGYNTAFYTMLPFGISGAAHGLAGGLLVLGVEKAAVIGFTDGYGWNGIAISLIARHNPSLVFPAAFFFSYLQMASRLMVLKSDIPMEITYIIQGIVFLTITLNIIRKRGKQT